MARQKKTQAAAPTEAAAEAVQATTEAPEAETPEAETPEAPAVETPEAEAAETPTPETETEEVQVKSKEAAPKQNGVARPGANTTTGRVWEISDYLTTTTGAPATRKAVLEATRAENIKDATASTQYGRWRKFHGLGREDTSPTRTQPVAAEASASEGAEAQAPEAAAEALPADTTVV